MPLVQILILGLERGEHVEILIFGKPTQITGYHFTNIYIFMHSSVSDANFLQTQSVYINVH